MKKITFKPIIDFVEIVIPTVIFTILFLTFVYQILSRYLLGEIVQWGMEVSQASFVWITLLGACYALRNRTHVEFTVVYDYMSEKIQTIMRISSSTLITFAMVYSFNATYEYISFMDWQTTSSLSIRYDYIFSVYLLFSVLVCYHMISDITKDIALLVNKGIEQ